MASVLQLISSLTMGGAERLLINFAASCQPGIGVPQVFVVINDRVHPDFEAELSASGHPVYFLKRAPGNRNPRIILTLLNIIRRHDIRAIHAHDSGAKHFAMLSKLYRPMSVGTTIHNTGIVQKWDRVKLRLHQRFVDWNIAISAAVQRECEAVKLKRLFKVHNGIPLQPFRSIDRARTFAAPLRLVNVARIYPRQKGQDILIKAVALCAARGLDLRCDFVGSPPEGDSAVLASLKALAIAEGVADRVRFVGGKTDVRGPLAEADIFVLPSRFEGFGLVLLEAMAAGLPVIAADVDGPAELLVDGRNGIKFEVGSQQDLADKIMALAAQPQLAARLAATARDFVTEFDIAHMRDQYFGIYSEMMKVG